MKALLVAVVILAVSAAPAWADEVALEMSGGTYTVPVTINGAVRLKFTLDSGASDVLIPADVALTLARSGTLAESDFIGNKTYSLADGSTLQSVNFYLREVRVGNLIARNVVASAGPVTSSPLLGQSFLSRFGAWTLDNSRHVLILGVPPASQAAIPALRKPVFNINRKWEDLTKYQVIDFQHQCFDVVKTAALRQHKRFCLLDMRKSYSSVVLNGEVAVVDILGNYQVDVATPAGYS
jgi:gag-polyprotein putative aspartyl protease